MDIVSYLIGKKSGGKGSGTVVIEGTGYIFTDALTNGNIVITKENE